jgi:hypothetical protein
MKNVRDTFKTFFQNEDIKTDIKELLMKPIFSMIYNEIYLYLWVIAVYNVFFVFIILAILCILLNIKQGFRNSAMDYSI